jgi:hypothetical protein
MGVSVMSREEKLKSLLAETRERIKEVSGDNPDEWFYANRFIFARLNLDERKTKTKIKQELFEINDPCDFCGEPFETKTGVHIHRRDGDRAYSFDNCVLMHPECHRQHHRENPKGSSENESSPVKHLKREKIRTQKSRLYEGRTFTYWWDIPPSFSETVETCEGIRFLKKDSNESCLLLIEALIPLLTKERQTSRNQGNWGVRVLANRPNELAFEPPTGSKDWKFLKVEWHT